MILQVGVKIFLKNKEGKFLLLKRSSEKYKGTKGSWDIVGGRIDIGSKLMENLKTIIAKVKEIKPSTAKGTYMKSITLCTTMGPGVKVAV